MATQKPCTRMKEFIVFHPKKGQVKVQALRAESAFKKVFSTTYGGHWEETKEKTERKVIEGNKIYYIKWEDNG